MHPMLQPMFPVKFAIGSGALWCAWTVAAVLVRTSEINAPTPAQIDSPQPFTVVVRSVRITPEMAFDDRWQAPAPAMQQAIMAETNQQASEQSKSSHHASRHVERHADPVCGSRGRRHFHTGRHLSWRCRR
jgi:hypothetical protein